MSLQASDFLNIRTDPLMVFGSLYVNLELEFKVTNQWTIGPFAQVDTSQPTFDTGIRAVRYEQGAYQQGWMTGIEMAYSQITPTDYFYNYESDLDDYDDNSFCSWSNELEETVCQKSGAQQIALSVDHGYFWRMGTFNTGFGMGGSVVANDEDWSDISVLPKLYFSIGWVR
jgi:hypothetical protein